MENIARINDYNFRKTLFKDCSIKDVFEMFLSDFSDKTKDEYRSAIEQFVQYAFCRSIANNGVTSQMLSQVTMFTAKKYYNALLNGDVTGSKLSPATSAKKIYALSAFWKVLPQYFSGIKEGAWKLRISKESTPYDTFSQDEVSQLISWAKGRGIKGEMLSLWFETSFATGIRKTAMCNLKWSEVVHKIDRKTSTMVWIIDTIDKGGKTTNTPISDELYEKLRSKGGKGERVFNISSKTIDRAMAEFKRDVIKDPTRKLCVHSIKSASIDMAYAVSGHDIQMARIQGHHTNSKTTEQHYLGKGVPMVERASYKYKPVQ